MLRQVPLSAATRRVLSEAARSPRLLAARRPRATSPAARPLTVPAAAAHTRRALVRLALLMRVVPLLQAVVTVTLGFSVSGRPWLTAAACCAALAWSTWLVLRIWATGHCAAAVCLTDTAVAVLVLLAVGAAIPAGLLTTSFYWAAPYAAATALLLGMSLPPRVGAHGLAVLIASYGLVVGAGAGAHALPAAAGNAAGTAVYFGGGVAIACYARGFTLMTARAQDNALDRQQQLGIRQARLDEFGRLHDEAVQVLERVASAAQPDARLRAYAASAARHLRAAIDDAGLEPGSVRDVLGQVAASFTARGFLVTVECRTPLPDPGAPARSLLAAAVTEALNNAQKHSGAGRAAVRAASTRHGLEVSVADEGIGFVTTSPQAGFGIVNCIHRRLEETGGSAEIRSVPGAGTVVRMRLPC